ncbi:MAG: FAD-binding oxidoreductase [Muribaculaceae bacterium]|nr:FAD-binding oxidoreductase [Muribaculaceae bacterium]
MEKFINDIRSIIPPERIYTDELRRLVWGTDAGFYRRIPKVVVRVNNEKEIQHVLKAASAQKIPVTFRAAGTSLSGQTVTDSVLIVASTGWENFKLSNDAATITLQPGITGERVNRILHRYGKIFSPDPASKASAMVGGIVINNASGMNCGTHANSDKILKSMRIVLADGTVIDTAHPSGSARERELLHSIAEIRDEIRADKDLCARINKKYSIKNVMGLNLRPFVAYDDPMEILAHLMVGSEGTLGFMSEVTVATTPLLPFTASAMVYFANMRTACEAVVELKKNVPEVYSCELLDRKSLESVNDTTSNNLTALLIETRADTQEELSKGITAIENVLKKYDLFKPVKFTSDPTESAALWKMRSGVFPAVGGTRPPGTTSLIEDVAFYIDDLPQATVELAALIEECGYDDACIYGHAFEGNYHFVIAQAFDSQADVDKYSRLIERIVELVVDKYDGSLKAEHGTGRNMAPFVEKEWGTKAFGIMKKLKHAFDPDNLLNPGVIFNDDPKCYIRGFKPLPLMDEIVDKCIECGFCEVNCVSCGLTFSARQRIVAQREIANMRKSGENPIRLKELVKDYKYLGEETCAADGLCSTSCPMGINTGELTHKLREADMQPDSVGYKTGKWAAEHLPEIESVLRLTLDTAHIARKVIGHKGVASVGKMLHKAGMPLWTPSLPKSYRHKDKKLYSGKRKVVYFPSCINRTMGISPEATKNGKELKPLVEMMVELCAKAGYEVIFPKGMKNLCCGMIWESKGMPDIADGKTAELEKALIEASEGGTLPVICDQSPCLHRMRQHIKSLRLYEPAEFIADFLAPHLKFQPVDTPVAVHVTCSSRLMGLTDKIIGLAKKCSTKVLVPEQVGCCGFAGDKGFTHPELNEWALRHLREQIEQAGVKEGFSNSRTCEIGLTTNSGVPYRSIAYLVDRVTTALPEK